jgi:DMSO/TMAO reductase YedYZ molybdopterin-dependent catalytic subunit
MVHGAGSFITNQSIDDFFQPDVLFAITRNHSALRLIHGYPVRLAVPHLYFWKSPKWVTRLEFMA